jgi:dimethylamine monooxygenase subunit A
LTHAALPPVAVPFVTARTYTVRADLTRLGQLPAHVRDDGPATLVRRDADAGRALDHALRELREAPDAVRAVDPSTDPTRLRAVAEALATALVGEGDPRVRRDAAGWAFPWLGLRLADDGALTAFGPEAHAPADVAARAREVADLLTAAPATGAPLRHLDALALALQEDVVVMTRDRPGDGGRAAFLHVVAPSGWDPGAHAGSSFARLHAPVPHRAPLDAAAGALVDALVARGPFVRFVWSLAPDGALGRHPRRAPAAVPVPPDRLWYRVERQTTLPVPAHGAFVFLIRVFAAPLAQVVADPQRRAVMAAAVASMDADLLAYKGLGAGRDALLAWLRAP